MIRCARLLAWTLPVLLLAACSGGLPAAADGTNLNACSDGSCEVQVKSGDAVPHPRLGSVTVTVTDDRIRLDVSNRDSKGNGSSMSTSGVAGTTLNMNGQPFKVVAVQGDQGVLRVGS